MNGNDFENFIIFDSFIDTTCSPNSSFYDTEPNDIIISREEILNHHNQTKQTNHNIEPYLLEINHLNNTIRILHEKIVSLNLDMNDLNHINLHLSKENQELKRKREEDEVIKPIKKVKKDESDSKNEFNSENKYIFHDETISNEKNYSKKMNKRR